MVFVFPSLGHFAREAISRVGMTRPLPRLQAEDSLFCAHAKEPIDVLLEITVGVSRE